MSREEGGGGHVGIESRGKGDLIREGKLEARKGASRHSQVERVLRGAAAEAAPAAGAGGPPDRGDSRNTTFLWRTGIGTTRSKPDRLAGDGIHACQGPRPCSLRITHFFGWVQSQCKFDDRIDQVALDCPRPPAGTGVHWTAYVRSGLAAPVSMARISHSVRAHTTPCSFCLKSSGLPCSFRLLSRRAKHVFEQIESFIIIPTYLTDNNLSASFSTLGWLCSRKDTILQIQSHKFHFIITNFGPVSSLQSS